MGAWLVRRWESSYAVALIFVHTVNHTVILYFFTAQRCTAPTCVWLYDTLWYCVRFFLLIRQNVCPQLNLNTIWVSPDWTDLQCFASVLLHILLILAELESHKLLHKEYCAYCCCSLALEVSNAAVCILWIKAHCGNNKASLEFACLTCK